MSDPYCPPELRDAGGARWLRPVPGGTLAALLGGLPAETPPAGVEPPRPDGTLGRLLAGSAAPVGGNPDGGPDEGTSGEPPVRPPASAAAVPASPGSIVSQASASLALPPAGPSARRRGSWPWLVGLLLLGLALAAGIWLRSGS